MLLSHPQFRAYLALSAVCIFWGTTYLGIRIALESFPPATLICFRFLISGTVMLAVALARKVELPTGRELLFTASLGVMILGIGTGCLVAAEQWIPSGLAAMFVMTGPFWLIGLEALVPGGAALHGPTLAGMLVGLAGTLLLVAPTAVAGGFHGPVLRGFLLLQLGSCGWSLGSILQRRHVTKSHPVVNGAVQQLATGLFYVLPALLLPHQPIRWSSRGVWAVLYLATFGSIVGYSAYIYTLQHLPVSIVSLYNYVNPVVAVLLGSLVFQERFGLRDLFAMGVIFLGVALVKRFGAASYSPPRSPNSTP